jgi:hypothetical protein
MKEKSTRVFVVLTILAIACMGCSRKNRPNAKPGQANDGRPPQPEWKTLAMDSAWNREFPDPSYFIYNGIPFVVYPTETDRGTGEAVVMNYVQGRWEPVGSPSFSYGIHDDISLLVYKGYPYVACSYYCSSDKPCLGIMKFDGLRWNPVGEPWEAGEEVESPSLFIKNDTPYVAYRIRPDSGSIVIIRYDGTAWRTFGKTIPKTHAGNVAFDYSGPVPYLVYSYHRIDDVYEGTAFVLKYDGTDWKPLGSGLPMNGIHSIHVGNSGGMPTVTFNGVVHRLHGAAFDTVPKPDSISYSGGSPLRFSVNDTMYAALMGFSPEGVSVTGYLCSPGAEGVTAGTRLKEVPVFKHWRSIAGSGQRHSQPSFFSFVVSDGTPYLASNNYFDKKKIAKIAIKKFAGGKWNAFGKPITSAVWTQAISLAVSKGTPYVAYNDGKAYKVSVRKFDGKEWISAGRPEPLDENSNPPSLFIDSGVPYLAYSSLADSFKVSVFKLSGADWVPLGKRGFSAGRVDGEISLYVDHGTPYAAFGDAGADGKAVVMKLNGSAWEPVGPRGISQGEVGGIDLSVENGILYTSFVDAGLADHLVVKKYSDNKWESLADSTFLGPRAQFPSLVVDSGTPYLSYFSEYVDYSTLHDVAIVKKFNGSSWEEVGWTGALQGQPILAISLGIPYVAAIGPESTSVMVYK